MAFQDQFNDYMSFMSQFIRSVKLHRLDGGRSALDANARLTIIALQSQVEAQQRAMSVLLHHFKVPGNNVVAELEKALKLEFPNFHSASVESDDTDPCILQTADAKPTELSEYNNWRWKLDRMSGLTGTKVLDYENVMLRLSSDHNNPDAVFVNNIKTQRSFELLYGWANNYFGGINVGGGQRPDNTWWVRIDHKAMKTRMLDYPNKGRVK